jgi:predicted GNAT family acetyltransferase
LGTRPPLRYDGRITSSRIDSHAMDDLSFSNNSAARRYQVQRGAAVAAHADYELKDGVVVLTHTEVLPAHEGMGLASKLAKFALDDVRQRGLKVTPQCEFMATYISRHPEYSALLGA